MSGITKNREKNCKIAVEEVALRHKPGKMNR